MKIKFHGHACFSIEQKDFNIVMDPHENLSGLSADVVTVSSSSPHHASADKVGGEPRVFDWPGEYETNGIHFKGIAVTTARGDSDKKKLSNIFKIHFKGIKVGHLGGSGLQLTDEDLETLGDVDVLFVPVGGGSDAKKIKAIVEEIEPRLIIPMRYADEKGEVDQAALNAFLADMGSPGIEALDEFKFKKSELPDGNSKVVVLNKQ